MEISSPLAIKQTTLCSGGRSLPALRCQDLPAARCLPGMRRAKPRRCINFSGRGEVYSYTTVYDAPAGYEENAPYTVALVKLEEGPMVTAQLTDLGDQPVQIGMPVEMVTRRLRQDGDERGMIVYGYKFRPVLAQQVA